MSDKPILTSKQLQGVAAPEHPQQQGLFDTSSMVRPAREPDPSAAPPWQPRVSSAWEHEETNGTPLKMLMTANEVREEYRPHENMPAMKIRESDRWGLRDSVKESGVRYPIHLSEGIHDKDYGAQRMIGNGHHRFFTQESIDPDRLMPVIHDNSVRGAVDSGFETEGKARDKSRDYSYLPEGAQRRTLEALKAEDELPSQYNRTSGKARKNHSPSVEEEYSADYDADMSYSDEYENQSDSWVSSRFDYEGHRREDGSYGPGGERRSDQPQWSASAYDSNGIPRHSGKYNSDDTTKYDKYGLDKRRVLGPSTREGNPRLQQRHREQVYGFASAGRELAADESTYRSSDYDTEGNAKPTRQHLDDADRFLIKQEYAPEGRFQGANESLARSGGANALVPQKDRVWAEHSKDSQPRTGWGMELAEKAVREEPQVARRDRIQEFNAQEEQHTFRGGEAGKKREAAFVQRDKVQYEQDFEGAKQQQKKHDFARYDESDDRRVARKDALKQGKAFFGQRDQERREAQGPSTYGVGGRDAVPLRASADPERDRLVAEELGDPGAHRVRKPGFGTVNAAPDQPAERNLFRTTNGGPPHGVSTDERNAAAKGEVYEKMRWLASDERYAREHPYVPPAAPAPRASSYNAQGLAMHGGGHTFWGGVKDAPPKEPMQVNRAAISYDSVGHIVKGGGRDRYGVPKRS